MQPTLQNLIILFLAQMPRFTRDVRVSKRSDRSVQFVFSEGALQAFEEWAFTDGPASYRQLRKDVDDLQQLMFNALIHGEPHARS